jgi:hypothetical protein
MMLFLRGVTRSNKEAQSWYAVLDLWQGKGFPFQIRKTCPALMGFYGVAYVRGRYPSPAVFLYEIVLFECRSGYGQAHSEEFYEGLIDFHTFH